MTMTNKAKVTASGTENDGGTVVSISGTDPGGHTASIRFIDPDYGPVFARFDGGDGLVVTNENEHKSVIVVIDEGDEIRADVTAFKPVKAKVTDENLGKRAKAGDPDAIASAASVARNISGDTEDEVSVKENDEEVKVVDTANTNPATEPPAGDDESVVARPGMNPDDIGKPQSAIDEPRDQPIATPDDPSSPHEPTRATDSKGASTADDTSDKPNGK